MSPHTVTEMAAVCSMTLVWVLLLAPILASHASEFWVTPSACDQSEGSAGSIAGSGNGGISPDPITLDTALQMVVSDTTLHLGSGVHCIDSFALLHGWKNISLIGESSDVIITCKKGLGFAFVNVTNLHLENLQIDSCELSNSELNQSVSLLKEIIYLFFKIPTGVRIALFLGHVENLWMENIIVKNTPGFGMVGINVIGDSLVRNSIFFNNVHTDVECNFFSLNVTLATGIAPSLFGGGAYFLYQDYLLAYDTSYVPDAQHGLSIENTAFYTNSDCSFVTNVGVGYKDSELYRELGYTIGGGGGLTVMLAQRGYGVNVTVSNASMVNNTARYGGGAHIVTFTGVTNSHILFKDNCTFISNGFPSLDFFSAVVNSTYAAAGGALAVFFDVIPPDVGLTRPQQRNTSVEFVDSLFVENAAYTGGAVVAYSYFSSTASRPEDALAIRFIRCDFLRNAAILGAAFWIYELKSSAREQVGMQVELQDIIVLGNIGSLVTSRLNFRVQDNPAVMYVRSVNVTITGSYVYIADNQGTALLASGSLVGIIGDNCTVKIERNTGVYGGAINMLQMSYLIVTPGTYLIVKNNTARIEGGAFYVNQDGGNPAFLSGDCFLYFSYQQFYACINCTKFNDTEFSIYVAGNSAPKGSTMYGSALNSCPWSYELRQKYGDGNILEILSENFPDRFTFIPPPTTRQQVITQAERLEIESESQEVYVVAPGETFNFNTAAIDGFNQTISTVIAAYVVTSSDNTTINSIGLPNVFAVAGDEGFAVLGNKPTSTVFRVFSQQDQVVYVGLYSVESPGALQAYLEVSVESCPMGFIFDIRVLSCACIPELVQEGIDCDVENLLLIVPDGVWVGPVGGGNSEFVVEDCIATYCVSERKTVDVRGDGFDTQCAEDSNRGGLLCGRCRSGYSIVLGSDRCLKCSNSTAALIVLFLALGILLVILISYFRITITGGFLNGVIFYSNVVNLFEPILTPVDAYDGRLALTSFLSLNLGIETCFYKEMDALQKIWWQLSFPLYLYFLMFVITFLARCCKWKRGAGFSITQAFVTLSVLCYVSVVLSCVELLGGIEVKTLSGARLERWIVDPTVVYFEGAHGILTFVAILLLIFYIIPLPLFLLFPALLYRTRFLKKLKPFYDAFWEPFEPRFRFWLGFRLMFRWLPLVVFYLVPFPVDSFVTGLSLLFLLCAQIMLQPFKGQWRNLLDNFFLLNLVVLFFGAVFFEAVKDLSGTDKAESDGTIFSTFLVILAYLGFVVVLVYHIITRYQPLEDAVKRCFRRGEDVKKVVMVPTSLPEPENLEPVETQDFMSIDHTKGDTVTQNQSGDLVRVDFTILREPLLDEGTVEIVTVTSPTEDRRVSVIPTTKDDKKKKKNAKADKKAKK